MKRCSKCGENKLESDFYLRSDYGRPRSACKACHAAVRSKNRAKANEYAKKYRRKNLETIRKNASDRYQKVAESQKAYYRARYPERVHRLLGVTKEQYAGIVSRQNGRCAICEIPFSELKRRPALDHCHKTGRVRGLLCGKCNSSIGMLGDSAELLGRAIVYLETTGR